MVRGTLKPIWSWCLALVLTTATWCVLIRMKHTGEIDGREAWAKGNLATALFFALPLSLVVLKLFGRGAGPRKNYFTRIALFFASFFLSFCFLLLLTFLCSEAVELFAGNLPES